jgi:SAM-dependent methyltransferase
MFARSAPFYDAVYAFKNYAAECERLHSLIRERLPDTRTLLDVACGTGQHLACLRARYDVEGLDVDRELLAIARERLPDVRLHEADMTEFELERRFDVVTCLFSSVGYARTGEGLRAAVAAMARHVASPGLLLVEPWIEPDRWQPSGPYAVFVDEPDLKVARINVSPPAGETVVLEMHYLVGTREGVEHFTERHELGMFTRDQYLESFRAAGLDVEHDPEGLMGRGLYIGARRA